MNIGICTVDILGRTIDDFPKVQMRVQGSPLHQKVFSATGLKATPMDYMEVYNAIKTDKKPFQIIWDYQAPDWDWWAIPKGTPKLDGAYRFIAFASDPQRMADQTKWISYGPANKDSAPLIDPAILPDLPSAPDNLKTVFYPDPQFWGDKGDELRERFNAWLAQ